MPGSRIVIDGLWRCLCPSYDAIGSFHVKTSLRRVAIRSCVSNQSSNRNALSRQVQTRNIHSGTAADGSSMPNNDSQSGSISNTRTEHSNNSLRSRNPSWDELSVGQLQDVLQGLKHKEAEYDKTINLVKHLLSITGQKPGLLHYDALIAGNSSASHGSAAVVAKLLQDAKEERIVPDARLYHSALQALAVHPDYVLRSEVLKEMDDRWFTLNSEGWHNLVIGLLRDRQYEMAMDKLERMQLEEISIQPWLYDMFIYLFCEAEELDEALRILRHRVEAGDMDISSNVWYAVLDASSRNYHYEGTSYVWEKRVEKKLINPPDGMCMNVLNTAARHYDAHLATDVIRVLASRKFKLDLHHYEALLDAYVGSHDLQTALRLLGIMQKAGLEVEEGTTRPLHTYLTTSRRMPTTAWKILQDLHEAGHEVPVTAVNCVLEAFVSNDQHREALEHYKSFHTVCSSGPNTATINTLLKNLVVLEDSKEVAMFLASEMGSLVIRPDPLTFDRLILVCLEDEDYEDAFRYLDEMKSTFPRSMLRTGTATAFLTVCAAKKDERGWVILKELEERGQATVKMRDLIEQALPGGFEGHISGIGAVQ